MSVTVLITTRKRPEYLKTALEGIRRQTCLAQINEVIVSENSSETGSKLVCDEFKDLNITYIQQETEITAVEHLYWAINQSKSHYTAMLHDDDWWYPTHLESALEALNHKECVGYFSNFVFAKNEVMKDAFFHYPSVIGFFAPKFVALTNIELKFADVAAICYLFTPFHMSTMVAKTQYLKKACDESLKDAKPWYADRVIYPFLSQFGTIAFNPQVLCGIREHANNDAKTINLSDRYDSHLEGSEKIQTLANRFNLNLIEQWKEKKRLLAEEDWMGIQHIYDGYFYKSSDGNSPFYKMEPKPVTKPKKSLKSVIKKIVKDIVD